MSKSRKVAQLPNDGNEKFTYKLKDLIWAKMKGFNPWPGMIVEPTADLMNQPHKINAKPVFFFGSRNFAWIEESQLKPFEGPWKERLASVNKPASFRNAIKDIEGYLTDSALIDKMINRNCRPNHVSELDFDKIRDGVEQNDESVDSNANDETQRELEEEHTDDAIVADVTANTTLTTATTDDEAGNQQFSAATAYAVRTGDGVLTANVRKAPARRQAKAKSTVSTAVPKINVAPRQRTKRRRTTASEPRANNKSKRIKNNGTVSTNVRDLICEEFSCYDEHADEEDEQDDDKDVTEVPIKTSAALRSSNANRANIDTEALLAISTAARQTPSVSASLLDRPAITRPAPRPEADFNAFAASLLERNIEPSNLTFGFLGIGVMGSIIVKDLLCAKHNVIIWNRTAEKCEAFRELGVGVKDTPIDVVEEADIIFCCVSDKKAAKELVFGNCGVLHNKDLRNKAYVELSTIDAKTSKKIGEGIAAHSGRYLEAQIMGSRSEAELGQLVILAAGDQKVFEECKSCFKTIAKKFYFLGDIGNASKVNLILQNIAHVSLAGLSESLALADRCSISLMDILNIFEVTSMCSPMLLAKGKEIAKGDFQAQQPVSHVQRELSLVMNLSEQLDQTMPVSGVAHEVFKHTKRLGYSEHDSSAVFVRSRF